MTNKILVLLLLLSSTGAMVAQSKKEVIEILIIRIDSLNLERNKQVERLNFKIKNQLDSLNLEIKKKEAQYSEEVISNKTILGRLKQVEEFLDQAKNIQPKVVTIEYTNEVSGFFVKVIWKPNNVHFEHTTGPAIIEFYNIKDSTTFTLTNNNFGVLSSKLPFSYSEVGDEIISINQNDIKLVYDINNLFDSQGFFRITNETFFFQDLDFDNKNELILGELDQGQRGVATFKAYKIYSSSEMIPDIYNITNEEPFKSLDEMSEVDHLNKRIIINGSGGWCAESSYIYKLRSIPNDFDGNNFILETIIQRERDDNLNKCFELKYRVISQSKQLISKIEIK